MNIKKILSFSLSGLLFANSFCMAPQAVNNNNNIVPPAPKSSRTLDFIKNNPKTSAGIAGGSLLAAGVLGTVGYLTYKYATRVTADDWFYRLGGTQQDIDSYRQLVNDYNAGKIVSPVYQTSRGPENAFFGIENDVNRYPGSFDMNGERIFLDSFNRILKIYYGTHTDVTYEQSWDYTMYMIYLKFIREKPNHDVLMPEEEAKVYFIYTKFMKMLNAKFGTEIPGYEPWVEYCSNYIRYQNNSNTDARIPRNINNIQGNSLAQFAIFKRGIFSAGANLFISYGDSDSSDEIIRIWDKIIMNDRFISSYEKNFDTDAVLENLNFIIYSYLASNKYPSFMNNVISPQ